MSEKGKQQLATGILSPKSNNTKTKEKEQGSSDLYFPRAKRFEEQQL